MSKVSNDLYAEPLLLELERKVRTLRMALQQREALLKDSAEISAALMKFTELRKKRPRTAERRTADH